jgi:hypothetical protein
LAVALRSIERYVTGLRRVVVVVPTSSLQRMDPAPFVGRPWLRLLTCRDYDHDYLGQQVTKLSADHFSDADVIVHLDSDQVFQRPCELHDVLFAGARLRIAYDGSGARPASDGWRRCPTEFFGVPIPYDLTTPLPLAVRSTVYRGLRQYCRRVHGVSLTMYALSTRADRFCEMALLRGFVLLGDDPTYTWVDVGSGGPLVPQVRTFWSRAEESPEASR